MFLPKSSLLLFASWGKNNNSNGGGLNILDYPATKNLQQILSAPFSNRNTENRDMNKSFQAQDIVQSFISTLNKQGKTNNDVDFVPSTNDMIMQFFDEYVIYSDTSFYHPIEGKNDLLRHFLLFQESDSSSLSIQPNRKIVIDDITSGLDTDNYYMINENASEEDEIYNVCVQYHLEEQSNDGTVSATVVPDSTGITFYSLRDNKIINVFDVLEPPSPKPGNFGLALLSLVTSNKNEEIPPPTSTLSSNANIVEKYFDGWNRRDMNNAIDYFSDNCVYQDLQYDTPFSGKVELEKHLLNVASCLPSSFQFKVDNLVAMPDRNSKTNSGKQKIGVRWHVESEDKELFFTKGCSFYTTDENGLIQSGVDIPEPAVVKKGAISSISKKFTKEPIRILPAAMWVAYMYIVFFSDGILPGANALALEYRTWEEVRDLSLNFFLVSPVLNLPFAPVVHPMLEGVFNLLLSWAALFAGFLSDEREDKPNVLPFGPIVIGMQFLTSAFLLPYLALRSPEKDYDEIRKETIYKEDITGSVQATIGEWKPLGPFLGSVGSASILWAIFARPEFGDLNERYNSFLDLLSIDRVGSSFLVDLAIFALFQGWFVDDDLKRRNVAAGEMATLRNVAKFVPFFGLAYYLTFRPELPSKGTDVME